MMKYLSFHNSSFSLRYFLMQMARPECDTPPCCPGILRRWKKNRDCRSFRRFCISPFLRINSTFGPWKESFGTRGRDFASMWSYNMNWEPIMWATIGNLIYLLHFKKLVGWCNTCFTHTVAMIQNLTPIKVGKHIRSSDTRRIYIEFVLPPYNLWREMEREWAIMVYIYIYISGV